MKQVGKPSKIRKNSCKITVEITLWTANFENNVRI